VDAVGVARHGNQPQAAVAEHPQRQVVGGRLHEHHVAGAAEAGAEHVEGLGGAAGDHELLGGEGHAVQAAEAGPQLLDQAAGPLLGAVVEGVRAVGGEGRRGGGRKGLDRQQGRVGVAPAELDDAGSPVELDVGERMHGRPSC
jgi:hypothetical protein